MRQITVEKELKIGSWLKSQQTNLEIKPGQYFDLVDILDRYATDQLNMLPVVVFSKFKERRLSLKLSIEEVIEQTDIKESTIRRIEQSDDAAFFDTVMNLDKFYTENGA